MRRADRVDADHVGALGRQRVEVAARERLHALAEGLLGAGREQDHAQAGGGSSRSALATESTTPTPERLSFAPGTTSRAPMSAIASAFPAATTAPPQSRGSGARGGRRRPRAAALPAPATSWEASSARARRRPGSGAARRAAAPDGRRGRCGRRRGGTRAGRCARRPPGRTRPPRSPSRAGAGASGRGAGRCGCRPRRRPRRSRPQRAGGAAAERPATAATPVARPSGHQ